MNKNTIKLLSIFLISMPLIAHSSALRHAIQPAKKVVARTMATLSDAQHNLLSTRLSHLQKKLAEENAIIQKYGLVLERDLSMYYVAQAAVMSHSKNRALAIEKDIFDIEFKLAEKNKAEDKKN